MLAHIIAEPKGRREARGGEDATAAAMDCCICSPMASIYRPPRNTICPSCYDGARAMLSFLGSGEPCAGGDSGPVKLRGSCRGSSSSKGISGAFNEVKEMRGREEELKERVGFLESFVVALKDGLHTDILVRPGSGAPIPAHRAVLAARSEIFRNTLSSDECKAAAGDAITLPELTHDELSALLAFLYSGDLAGAGAGPRLRALLLAADKYDIPFLRARCERRALASLQEAPAAALQVLEASELCSDAAALRARAMAAAVERAEEVVFSPEYDEFAARNAGLCVEFTRALLVSMREKGARDGTIDQKF